MKKNTITSIFLFIYLGYIIFSVTFLIANVLSNFSETTISLILEIAIAAGTIGATFGAFHAVKKNMDIREEEKKEKNFLEKKASIEKIAVEINRGIFNIELDFPEIYRNEDFQLNILKKLYSELVDLYSKLNFYSTILKSINIFFNIYISDINKTVKNLYRDISQIEKNFKILDKAIEEVKEEAKNEDLGITLALLEENNKKNERLLERIEKNKDTFLTKIRNLYNILTHILTLDHNVFFSLIKNSKDLSSDKFVDKLSEVLHTEFPEPEEEFDFTMPEDIVKIPEELKENENK